MFRATSLLAPLCGALLLGAQALLAAPQAAAALVQVSASAIGRYDSSGAGFVPGFATDSRAFASQSQFLDNAPFFVFNLPTALGQVTEAVLRLTIAPNGISLPTGEASARLQAFEVTTPAAEVLTGRFAGSAPGQAIFRDLTSGIRFADIIVPREPAGGVVAQVLDNTALTALNAAAEGARFVIGLSPLLALNGTFVQFSGARLDLTTEARAAVPAPAAVAVLGLGLILLGALARRGGSALAPAA